MSKFLLIRFPSEINDGQANLREFLFHDEFLVTFITGQNDWLIADIIVAEFIELMLEIVFAADGKFVAAGI